ncbi:MAG TPA: hypothetical protein VNK41_02855 [Vicinamibacterales bacterium]|nr:hypothetical protein [Vicinamibacterales bacterium]
MRDHILAAALLLSPALAALAATPVVESAPRLPKPKDAAALARAYADRWLPALGAIVAEERYQQTLTTWEETGQRETSRVLVSDVLLIQARGSDVWMMFRDVMTVDGHPVRDREQRFEALFVRPGRDLIPTARRIAGESARFNLGIERDLNTPAAALIFLRDSFAESTRWRRIAAETVDGQPAWKLTFEQKTRPFAIRTAAGLPQPAAGHIWIEPESGRILRTELDLWNAGSRPEPRVHVLVTAQFGPVSGIDARVPLRMWEAYEIYSRRGGHLIERLEGRADYTNHRRFQTDARVVG